MLCVDKRLKEDYTIIKGKIKYLGQLAYRIQFDLIGKKLMCF